MGPQQAVDATARAAGRRIDVLGLVQGVGFRPFVYRLATELGVDGTVRNRGGHVVIDAVAAPSALDELARRLTTEAPPLARVRSVTQAALPLSFQTIPGFRVEPSEISTEAGYELPADIAPCDECIRELLDPLDRRFRYPFINCTNCGPRATIIDALPYDRSRTVMAAFPMCWSCRTEYDDPADRRFHAEPIACVHCGPTLGWRGSVTARAHRGDAALLAAERAIGAGGIVALKGLGGYQLVCDATNAHAVRRLRELKHRPRKPFAVMVADPTAAQRVAVLSDAEITCLVSPERPIVLATPTSDSTLASAVHPGIHRVGVFLPSTPMHVLLLRDMGRPLVVTSGNVADAPMVIDDDEAALRLAGTVAGFLYHDRAIRARYDDSVMQEIDGRPQLLRRARGYAPTTWTLPVAAAVPLLAVGAELKHTFTLATGSRATMSSHIGDLENVEAFDSFVSSVEHLSKLAAVSPELIVHDLHPGYLSTGYARKWPARQRMIVQHHHAHVAACAAEFGVTEPFIGVAYDGLGMGDDGTLWGGEVLIADLRSYRRIGRFSHAPMPGGATAARRPARMALGYIFGAETFDETPPAAAVQRAIAGEFFERIEGREIDVVERMVGTGFNCPRASSAGRLFDTVASLLGLADDSTFEGEAALAVENAAVPGGCAELPWSLRWAQGLWVYDARPTLSGVLDAIRDGDRTGVIAARFHQTLVVVTAAMCAVARDTTGIDTVCLGGGVFQNRILATALLPELRRDGFTVHLGKEIPPNDGGISFGQAAVAAARTAGG